jgi:hypothetical protein
MPEGHTIHRVARDQQIRFARQNLKVSSPQDRLMTSGTVLVGNVCLQRFLDRFGLPNIRLPKLHVRRRRSRYDAEEVFHHVNSTMDRRCSDAVRRCGMESGPDETVISGKEFRERNVVVDGVPKEMHHFGDHVFTDVLPVIEPESIRTRRHEVDIVQFHPGEGKLSEKLAVFPKTRNRVGGSCPAWFAIAVDSRNGTASVPPSDLANVRRFALIISMPQVRDAAVILSFFQMNFEHGSSRLRMRPTRQGVRQSMPRSLDVNRSQIALSVLRRQHHSSISTLTA